MSIRAIHTRLLCRSVLAAAMLSLPAAAYAQTAGSGDQAESSAEDEAEVVVTGTSIRGIPPTGSGLIGVSREDAKLIGAASTPELLATVPQLNSFNTAPRVSNGGLGSFAPGLRGLVDPLVAAHAPGVPIELLDGRSHEALAACDVTMVASGTATLEAALFKRPMVITYRMAWLNW